MHYAKRHSEVEPRRTVLQPSLGSDATWGNQANVEDQGLHGAIQGPPAEEGPEALPDDLALHQVWACCFLPADTQLGQGLQTVESTRMVVVVDAKTLELQFIPPLELVLPFPVSNVDVAGLTYGFASAAVTEIDARNSQWLFSALGTVEEGLRDFVRRLLEGTAAAKPGYDPFHDPELSSTLSAIAAKGQAGQGSGGPAPDPYDYSVGGVLQAQAPVGVGPEQNGLVLTKGATLSISVELAEDDLALDTVPPIQSVRITSDNLVLQSKGAPVALLQDLTIKRGGEVDVTKFVALGKAASLGHTESLFRTLAGLLVIQSSGAPQAAQGLSNKPQVVNALLEAEVELGLTKAVAALVSTHWDAIPGTDLRTVLGVP